MADITQVSGSGTLNTTTGVKVVSSSTSSGSSSTTDTVDKFKQQFMSILLTQMENQNPLDPMDTKEFTGQLAQFSSLEQQVTMNSKLDSLLSAIQTSSMASSFGYIGQSVELNTSMTAYQNDAADWTYALPEDAETVNLTVTDEAGNIVYTTSLSDVDSGTYALNLTKDDLKKSVADGTVLTLYIDAQDAGGEDIVAEAKTVVQINGIETTDDGVEMRAGNLLFGAADIKKIVTA
jgi:flagellar basal-body rod modification protein FlgD